MNEKIILAFRANQIKKPLKKSPVTYDTWSPSFREVIPPGKPKRYLIFTLFNFFRVFHPNRYTLYRAFKNKELVSSFLVVPAYFKWPFMNKGSVQFTYVMTSFKHRGKGLAWQGIYKAYVDLKGKGVKEFWYITDSDNIASQNLARKMGFELIGTLEKSNKLFGALKTLKLKHDK